MCVSVDCCTHVAVTGNAAFCKTLDAGIYYYLTLTAHANRQLDLQCSTQTAADADIPLLREPH